MMIPLLIILGGIENTLGSLALTIALVILGKHLLWDTVEQFLGEDTQQRPSQVQRIVNGS